MIPLAVQQIVSCRRASLCVSPDYSLIFDILLCPLDDSAGVTIVYSQPTHIGTAKNCLSPSPCNFSLLSLSLSHTHIWYIHVLNPDSERDLFQYNGAPLRKELVTITVNMGMGVFKFHFKKLSGTNQGLLFSRDE